MSRYNFKEAEARWQRIWSERRCFAAPDVPTGKKYYVLEMFPYPSGRIHMGHVRNYTMGDVVARFMRAQGHEVMHPMGWDAFGLPAENAAMERGIDPRAWTYGNIDTMRRQLQGMGLSIDWDRDIATCDVAYYRHQQRLFLDFLAAGLVDRKESWVNWDPVDKTVLANEQVIDGRGWRSGALIERRKLSQWFFRITEFSEDLLAALHSLERWPERVRLMQQNWIGRSEGAEINFEIEELTIEAEESKLIRVLQNLVSNSIDSFEEGSGVITIIARKKQDGAEIIIRDNGMGVPEQIRDKLFEPFVTYGKSGGTGLGTAIVKSVVDAHRGSRVA